MRPRQRRMIWPALILGVGIVWILQGFDLLGQDGGMNGDSNWTLIGGVTALIGAGLLILELRRKT